MLATAVYALRFLVELTALVALGYWGLQTGDGPLVSVALAVAAPLGAAGVWGTFVAPKAPYRLPGGARLAVELLLFGLVAVALVTVGRPTAAGVFAGLAVITSGATFLLERHESGE
ncbi:YrdB family protein [Halorarius halobius]|uniref:YrdB family protein n=1 Tax=Halorarius halobius TaxID=2962671 RepID=UPI0020CFE4DF|nr:YrdB family protein [Halorarius halobius]